MKGKSSGFWRLVQRMNEDYCKEVVQPEQPLSPFLHRTNNARRCALRNGKIINF